MKKYEIIKEGYYFRVKALKDFRDVKKGDIGGFIEKEDNLSQEGECWIFDNAEVYDNARISDNAIIMDNAKVFDNAKIYDDARICDNAIISDNARVSDYAVISNDALIYDNARVLGNSVIKNNAKVSDNAIINDYAKVSDNARVRGNAVIKSVIRNINDYIVLGLFGEHNRYITLQDKNKVACGCFYGTIDKFIKEVRNKYGEDYGSYARAIRILNLLEEK